MITCRLLFDYPSADLVASGDKRCTIRRAGDGLPKRGDRLQLCRADSTPERFTIRDDVTCTSVQPIRLYRDVDGQIAVDINGVWQDDDQLAALAKADGFRGVGQFLAYFKRKGLPFKGVLIKWAPAPEASHAG